MKLEQQLDGLEGVCNIHDDILVYGEGDMLTAAVKNHDECMCRLLQRCTERGIVLNAQSNKFILKQPQLLYMGHVFSADGPPADPKKVQAIVQMPKPDSSNQALLGNGKLFGKVRA